VSSAKVKINKMVEVMGWKAVGSKLTDFSKSVEMSWEEAVDPSTPQTGSLFE